MRVATLVLTVVLFPVLGCGGGGGGGTTSPATVASVSLSRSSALLKPSESVSITATAKDASGNTINGRTVTWNNSNSSVVSVASSGSSATVTGTVLGTSGVSATVDQITSPQATITVTNSFATSANVTVGAGGGNVFDPAQVDIASGGTVNFSWTGVTHNVTFQTTPPGASNISDRSSGTVGLTFTQAGNYPYQCTIHPGMNGNVTVH